MTTEIFVFRDKYATYEELEKDKRIYDFMSYRQRLISNDKSIKLYGDDNLSRYNDMKYDFLKQMNPRSMFFDDSIYIGTMVSEAGSGDPGFSISDLLDNWEDKIARAIEAENSGLIMAIIIDTAIEEYTLDTLALLTEKYTSFTMLNENLRNLSNQTALNIFGLDNYNLYTTIKNYVLTKFDMAAAISPDEITSYRMAVNVESSNPLDSLLRRLDIKKELEGDKLSLYESIAFNGIRNSLVKPKEDIAPEFVPFFTPDEMEDFGVNSGEVNLYSPEPDNDMVGDIPIAEWFEKYKQTNGYMENSKDWYLTLQKLYSDYDSLKEAAAGEEELNARKQSILELGWNPELDFNTDMLRGAKIRNYEYLKEHLPVVVDLTRYYENYTEDTHSALYEANERLRDIVTSKFKPIYIALSYTGTAFGKVISKWTDSVYTHASLSLDSTMKKLYTFSTWIKDKRIDTGLIVESIDDYIKFNDGSKISVSAVFVSDEQHNRINAALNNFIAHSKETKYNFKNIFNIVINKSVDSNTQFEMVCSQFVDVILKMANINLVDKSSNLVTPKDFYMVDDPRVFKLYDGPAKDYNKMKIDKMIDDLRVKPDTTRLSPTNLENAVDVLYYADNIKKIKGVKLDDDVYKQVIDLLSADTVIKEARLGLNVNKDGDVELTKPKDINAEFFRSNRILKRYKANGNAEGIKYELAKLMYLDTITDKNKGKKEYMDAKARINNTIKTYLEFIAIKEPDFNMSEYYEKSEFYHGKITIGKNTVKSIAALGKALIRR